MRNLTNIVRFFIVIKVRTKVVTHHNQLKLRAYFLYMNAFSKNRRYVSTIQSLF